MSATLRQQSREAASAHRQEAARDLDLLRRGQQSRFVGTVEGAIEYGFGATKYPTRNFRRWLISAGVRTFRHGRRVRVLRADILAAMASQDAEAREQRRTRRADAAQQRLKVVDGGR